MTPPTPTIPNREFAAAEATRVDVDRVRFALSRAPAGPDRIAGAAAFERLCREWIPSEAITIEEMLPTPRAR